MRLIKNAIVFKAELPPSRDTEEHLSELLHQPIQEVDPYRLGFVPNPISNELVTTFEGGFSFSLRLDEKIMPAAAVRSRVSDAIAEAEKNCGRKLNRSERDGIRDTVRIDLCRRALVKSTVITSFYHSADKLLIVATPSKRLAQLVVSQLIKVIGSVKTETIHISDIKNGLTTRLGAALDDESEDKAPFGDFELGGLCQLVKPGEKVSYQLDNLEAGKTGLQDSIGDGFVVDRLGLTDGTVAFKLTADFQFKGIAFCSEIAREEAEEMDPVFVWRQEAAVRVLQLSVVINRLCDLLGYKPKAATEAQ